MMTTMKIVIDGVDYTIKRRFVISGAEVLDLARRRSEFYHLMVLYPGGFKRYLAPTSRIRVFPFITPRFQTFPKRVQPR